MSVNCRPIDPLNVKSVWNEISRVQNQGTFFHTPIWSEIVSAVFPHWEIAPLAFEFTDGNLAVIPFLRRRLLLGDFWYTESTVPGVYGGPIFLNPPNNEHWEKIWQLIRKVPNFVLVENPFKKSDSAPPLERRQLFTQLLALEPNFSQMWRNFSKGHRANIKAAKNARIEIGLAQSIDDVKAYYFVYENSLARWGKDAGGFYPLALFVHLLNHSEYGKSIRLWVTRENTKIIAGGWFFYHHDQVTYWHSAVIDEFMDKFPMHLLISSVIEDACNRNEGWFDFCPSGGLAGVEKFKKGFGAHKIYFSAYRNLNPLGRAFRLSRYLGEHYLRKSFL